MSNSSTAVPYPESDSPNQQPPTLQQTHEGEHHGDFGNVPVQVTRAAVTFALCAAVNSCNLGYDLGVSTLAAKLVQDDWELTDVQRQLFVGSIDFWAMFGALMSQAITDVYGRRRTFLVAAVGFIVGVTLQSLAGTFSVLMIGRIFVGLAVGVGLAIDPLYIAEISPAKHRGELVTWSEIALNVGIVFGFTTGLIFHNIDLRTRWRVMFGVGNILPLVMIYLVVSVMPESPRWLVSQNREAEAREVLRQVYPPNFSIDPVVEDIKEALAREQAAERSVGWSVICCSPTPAFQRILLVGIGTAVAQQAVGIDAIQYYLLDVLEGSGIESDTKQLLILIFLGLLKLAFIVVGGKLFDKRGRRPLMFVSLIGMAVACFLVSLSYYIHSKAHSTNTVIGLALYLSFFSIGIGPGAWLIPSEIFPIVIRAKSMSLATFMNRATATLMASTFLSTKEVLTWGGFFLLLAIICLVVLAFLYFYLPETKGRSLEDMSLYFAEVTGDVSILEAEANLKKQQGRSAVELSSRPASTTTGKVGSGEVL